MCDLILEGKADMVIGDRLSSTYFQENNLLLYLFSKNYCNTFMFCFFNTNVKQL